MPQNVEHLLRRAGFGFGRRERLDFNGLSYDAAVDRLIDFEKIPDDVDSFLGNPSYLNIVPGGAFNDEGKLVPAPFDGNKNLLDAMQRWVFRMVHSRRPLQEKMTLFWHNHFATGRSKIIETFSFPGALRAFATKKSDDPDGAQGQIEMFRDNALGNFRDLLLKVARDPAMIAWLDGHTNIVGKPQENFIRELMELFTIGPESFKEQDVYAGARVFTGWNLEPIKVGSFDVHYRGFKYYPEYHDTGFKTFTFPIYKAGALPTGAVSSNIIPAREPITGQQDGIELINALAAHPATGAFLAKKLYAFFVSETQRPPSQVIDQLSQVYYASNFSIREMLRSLFKSAAFTDPAAQWTCYSWPAEYIVRAIKEVGWVGMRADEAIFAMSGMGQSLYDPPSVGGWRLGRNWFSTTTMLGRMNFAFTLCWSQRDAIAEAGIEHASSVDEFLNYFLGRLTYKPISSQARATLRDYINDNEGAPWTGSADQVRIKGPGLVRLILGLGEYQLI